MTSCCRCSPSPLSRFVCLHDSNEIPTAIPMFSGSGNKTRLLCGDCPTCRFVRNQRLRILTSDEQTSQPIHMSGSLRSSLVVYSPSPKHGYGRWNCVDYFDSIRAENHAISINFRLMAAIFDFQHTQTLQYSLSLSVLPYPEN